VLSETTFLYVHVINLSTLLCYNTYCEDINFDNCEVILTCGPVANGNVTNTGNDDINTVVMQ
jgi:hypothetical protein